MDPWKEVTSKVAFLPYDDIDTDTIIPQVELITTGRTGLGEGLFANWRYDERRRDRPVFVLNQPPYRTARVLATGRNFGCGSSREHAVWALADFGIQCVLAASFGPIFYRNCLRSRIAPLTVSEEVLDELRVALGRSGNPGDLHVELSGGRAVTDRAWPVEVDQAITEYVVEGLDEVGRTLRGESDIARYEREHEVPPLGVG